MNVHEVSNKITEERMEVLLPAINRDLERGLLIKLIRNQIEIAVSDAMTSLLDDVIQDSSPDLEVVK